MITNCHVKELRKAAGFTQNQLAIICGVSQNTISNIETGVYYPTLKLALNMAYALNCDVKALYDYSPADILP